ncbi:inner membrane protein YbaN [Oxobacter pfennigii]|uniref:Inner membrane protein YbaN n=1 Tax=Oxobacter pfennigii TaxID=36849 RepID=A0A0P8WKM3_9CLOT|nr:YbaN family protein [Oxobacter pfennigii]KPU42887.1 inner membrane protein YbaN [Oxobacter pfennigii]
MELYSIKKYLLVFLGSLSLALGVAGIIIPLLPTTPLLLLASYCYLRSSKRLYNWLINHKVFGKYILYYLTYKAIPKKTKITAIFFLWSTLIISMILVSSLHIRLFLILVGIGVTVHLMMLKTLSLEDIKALNDLHCKPEEQTSLNEE